MIRRQESLAGVIQAGVDASQDAHQDDSDAVPVIRPNGNVYKSIRILIP